MCGWIALDKPDDNVLGILIVLLLKNVTLDFSLGKMSGLGLVLGTSEKMSLDVDKTILERRSIKTDCSFCAGKYFSLSMLSSAFKMINRLYSLHKTVKQLNSIPLSLNGVMIGHLFIYFTPALLSRHQCGIMCYVFKTFQ